MYNRFEVMNLIEYLKNERNFQLIDKEIKFWNRENRKTRVLIRMRFDLNFITFVKNLETIKIIWKKFAKKYKFKNSEHVNFVYDVLNSCKFFVFVSIDDYVDKFIELMNQLNIYTFIDDSDFSKSYFIYRFHLNLDSEWTLYCEIYAQIHSTYIEKSKMIFDFIYVTQHFINICVNFIVDADSFVSSVIIASVQLVLNVVSFNSTSSIQIEIIFDSSNNRIIIKLIQHCIHCEKNYHIEKFCELKYSHLTKKRERRNQNNKNRKMFKNNDEKSKKNEKNNEKFKNKILKVVKTFFVENFDFIVKNAFMIAFRISVSFVWIWNFDVSQHYCCDKFVFKFDIYIFIIFYAVEDIDDIVKIVDENQIFLKCRDSNDHLIFFNIMTRYCLDVFVNFLFNYKLEEKKIDCQLFKKNVNIDKNDIIAHISSILVNFLILNLWISFIEFAFSAMKKSLLFFLRDDDADELALSNTKFVDISFDRFFFVFSDRKRKYNEKHIHEWHKRLTHSFRRIVFKIMKHSVVNFIKFFSNNDLCDTCVKTFFKQKFHDIFIVFNWFSNDFIHNDIEKSLKLNINENVVLYFIFMCDKIKRFKMYIINHKFQIYMCFKIFKKFVKYENCRIHRLKTNWENEYQNYDFEVFHKEKNIDWKSVIFENSFANDAIERLKQTFMKQTFVMLDDVDFSLKKNIDRKRWRSSTTSEIVNL